MSAISPKQFRDIFARLHNTDRWVLEDTGLIPRGPGGDSKWERFNSDLTTFVLKLSEPDLAMLLAIATPKDLTT